MLPSTTERVPAHTAGKINRRIERQIRTNVAYYTDHPEQIETRLRALDREWDIERMLEANASSLALAGTALGGLVDRRFLVLPAVVTGFLLQHALQGWCPPVPILRRRGFRTIAEIDRERYALKALRGDFEHLQSSSGSEQASAAVDGASA